MKISTKPVEKKQKIKKKPIDKDKKGHVLIVAQEIKFARLLSGNEKKTRDRVLKALKKWLFNSFQKGYEFKEDDFIRVWKGIFYAVWMSDKPLIQEELCETIASILDQFPPEQIQHAVLMTKAGLKVLATEWYGIDHHRMDKFLMLVRRYLRGSLRCLRRCEWSLESCEMYANMLSDSDGLFALKAPHYARNALSMALHIVDCFLVELAKVSNGEIPAASLVALLRPFCGYMAGGEAPSLYIAARRLLTELVRQSEPGLRYQHATLAWKSMGCPRGGPEALELVSDDDDDNEGRENGDHDASDNDEQDMGGRPLDPRAGRVDVEVRPLPVPARDVALMLKELLRTTSSKAHKRVKICMERFERLAQDEYPLPVAECDPAGGAGPRLSAARAARALQALDKRLITATDELALRGLGRKHRKRLLAKSRTGASIVEDVQNINKSLSNSTNGNWQVESTEPETKTKTQNDNKENQRKIKNKKLKDKQKNNKRKMQKDTDVVVNKRQKLEVKKDKIKKGVKNITGAEKSIPNGHIGDNILHQTDAKIDKRKENKETTPLVANLSGKVQVPEKDKTKGKKNAKIVGKNVDIGKASQKVSLNVETTKNKVKMNGDSKKITKIKDNQNKVNVNSQLNTNKKTKPTLLVNKVKNFQKPIKNDSDKNISFDTPKKVKFVLKNNCMQNPVEYYKSVRQSPNIPFDSSRKPSKTNLKPSTPSPINPFFKKKLRIK